jgi:hypothetical protein
MGIGLKRGSRHQGTAPRNAEALFGTPIGPLPPLRGESEPDLGIGGTLPEQTA